MNLKHFNDTLSDLYTFIIYLSVFYHCSFRDESDNSFEGDVMLLMAGVGVIICYVAIILGKFNEVEHKVGINLDVPGRSSVRYYLATWTNGIR